MTDRVSILQAKFLKRSTNLPDGKLLQKLLHQQSATSRSHWNRLAKGPLWQCCVPLLDSLDNKSFMQLCRQFLQDYPTSFCTGPNIKLLFACCTSLTQGPILWLPMIRRERSRVLRWRLGRLPDGKPKPWLYHPNNGFARAYSIKCLDMHRCLQLPISVKDLVSFILNKFPPKKLRSSHETSA